MSFLLVSGQFSLEKRYIILLIILWAAYKRNLHIKKKKRKKGYKNTKDHNQIGLIGNFAVKARVCKAALYRIRNGRTVSRFHFVLNLKGNNTFELLRYRLVAQGRWVVNNIIFKLSCIEENKFHLQHLQCHISQKNRWVVKLILIKWELKI